MPRAKAKPSHEKTYEFKIYIFVSTYMEETELLTTFIKSFRSSGGEAAQEKAEEWARMIGRNGITVENPKGHFTFYPADRIAKVEFLEVHHHEEVAPIE